MSLHAPTHKYNTALLVILTTTAITLSCLLSRPSGAILGLLIFATLAHLLSALRLTLEQSTTTEKPLQALKDPLLEDVPAPPRAAMRSRFAPPPRESEIHRAFRRELQSACQQANAQMRYLQANRREPSTSPSTIPTNRLHFHYHPRRDSTDEN